MELRVGGHHVQTIKIAVPSRLRAFNAFDGGPVQPRTIGLDQSVQMTKQLVWDLDQLVQHLDRLFGLLVETVCRV